MSYPLYGHSLADGHLMWPKRVDPKSLKRRVTANRKERRRTLSINAGFAELRCKIPYVPADTKLSKIKILRLATSYIAFLRDLLANEGGPEHRRRTASPDLEEPSKPKKLRTGWPQQVWALELKQETSSVTIQVGDALHA